MKVLAREKFERPIHLIAGDSIAVTFKERGFCSSKTLCQTTLTTERAGAYDEAVLFATEFEGRAALGGLVLKQQ